MQPLARLWAESESDLPTFQPIEGLSKGCVRVRKGYGKLYQRFR